MMAWSDPDGRWLIHAGAGAISGAINAGITGGNVGLGALTSGLSAGVAEGIGGVMQGADWFKQLNPSEKIFAGLVSNVGIGAVTGGVTSEIVCGQFLHGFGQGAWTAAYGFLFNDCLHGLCDDFPAVIPPDADPTTYRPLTEEDALVQQYQRDLNDLAGKVGSGTNAVVESQPVQAVNSIPPGEAGPGGWPLQVIQLIVSGWERFYGR